MAKRTHTIQVIELTVNGHKKTIIARNADTLLYSLRETVGFMSVKAGCENGDCGSCTVLVDDVPINSCHMLAAEAAGHSVTTLEGIMDDYMQQAFIENWALQCGYCTPGFIVNCHALLKHHPDADEDKMNEWLDSNICRCTGYQEMKEVIRKMCLERRGYDEKHT